MNPFGREFSFLLPLSPDYSQESAGQMVPRSPSLSELNPHFSPVPSGQSLDGSQSSQNSTLLNPLSPVITRFNLLQSPAESPSTTCHPVSSDAHVVPTIPSNLNSSDEDCCEESELNDDDGEVVTGVTASSSRTTPESEQARRVASWNNFPEFGLFNDDVEDIFDIEIDLFNGEDIFA